MYLLRTRFARDIVTEFLPPQKASGKVIVYCAGMPSVPSQKSFMEFFARKGYWVFFPRYRGTWESRGAFLKRSPHEDILDVIKGIYKPFHDFWDGKRFVLKPKEIFVIGSSFGGPAAIFASRDARVSKVVALSPVIDWRKTSKVEPLPWLGKFSKNAFGEAYRFSDTDWKKLSRGSFYNPATEADSIDGKKVFLIHAKDDDVVVYGPTEKFAKEIKAKLLLVKRGGHFSGRLLTEEVWYKKIKKFFAS